MAARTASVFSFVICCFYLASLSTAVDPNATKYPQCVELIFNSADYVIQPDAQLLVGGNLLINESDYELIEKNTSARVCYPLSTHFHRCSNKFQVPVSKYKVVGVSRSIVDIRNNHLWPLGEYYISSPEGEAIVCQICNTLTLEKNEYVHDSKEDTFTILESNTTFYSPKFTIDPKTQIASVCYPIVSPKPNCEWAELEERSRQYLTDKRLRDRPSGVVYELDKFVNLPNKDVAICIPVYVPPPNKLLFTNICTILFAVSAACLAVSIVVHIAVPQLSFQRAPLICHAFSLMIVYIFFVLRNFLVYEFHCHSFFYISYIATLSTFTWLTVLSFDVWRLSSSLRNGGKGYNWADEFCNVKFLLYSLFGFGVPALFAAFVTILDYRSDYQDAIGLHPEIESMCWFNEIPSRMYLLYIPMAILLIVNFLFFFVSVINLCCASRNEKSFNNIRLNKQLLLTLFVVFLVMGVFWIMEIVSAFDGGSEEKWYITDGINACQGIIIALVYTCSPFLWKRKPITAELLFQDKYCNEKF